MIVRTRVKVRANGREYLGVALVDTGATSTLVDHALLDELKIRAFGEREVASLGAVVKCAQTDVENIIIEDVEIGPRRMLVYSFPNEMKERLKSLECSDKMLVGVAEVESAGYMPNTTTGTLQKVGFIAL